MILESLDIGPAEDSCLVLPPAVVQELRTRDYVMGREFEGCLMLCAADTCEVLVRSIWPDSTDPRVWKIRRFLLQNASNVELDSRDRLLLPEHLADLPITSREMSLLFLGNRARIVPSAEWHALESASPDASGGVSSVLSAGDPFSLRFRGTATDRERSLLESTLKRLGTNATSTTPPEQASMLAGALVGAGMNVGAVAVRELAATTGFVLRIPRNSGPNALLYCLIDALSPEPEIGRFRGLLGTLGPSGEDVDAFVDVALNEHQSIERAVRRVRIRSSDLVTLAEWSSAW